MKTYLVNKRCQKCGNIYDPINSKCPFCKEENDDKNSSYFHNFIHASVWKEMAFFLLSIIGLTFFSIIIQLIEKSIFVSQNKNATTAEIANFLSSLDAISIANFTAYFCLFVVMAVLLFKNYKEIVKQIKIKNFLWGLYAFLIILVFTYVYGLISTLLFKAANIDQTNNANESTIRLMVKAYPVFSIIIFGFIGPLTEETGYRIGLFSLTSRFGKWIGYIATALIFAFIHFDWTSFGNTKDLIVELINIPSYIVAGGILFVAHRKGGFLTSSCAHISKNLLSLLLSLI